MIHRIKWQAICLRKPFFEYAAYYMLQFTSKNWEVVNAFFYIFDGNDGETEDLNQFGILVGLRTNSEIYQNFWILETFSGHRVKDQK